MDLSTWKQNMLARAAARSGDLTVSPTIDVKPDSIDQLLTHDSCCVRDFTIEDVDEYDGRGVAAVGPACR